MMATQVPWLASTTLPGLFYHRLFMKACEVSSSKVTSKADKDTRGQFENFTDKFAYHALSNGVLLVCYYFAPNLATL